MSDTLHEVLARGIDKGLRDVGADLTGCTPSTLTGHVIRELLAAGLHPGPSRKRTPSATEPQWRIGVEIPMRLPQEDREELLTLLGDTADRWAEQARDTGDDWEANVYGCRVADDAPMADDAPISAYGIAPDTLPPGVVLTAQRIIDYIRPEWDPNDAWDYDIVGPLLRTICSALVDSPLVAKENDAYPEPGVYGCGGCDKDKPGYCSNCPDRPAATPRPEEQR